MGKAGHSQEKASKSMGKGGSGMMKFPAGGKGNKAYCPKLVTSKSMVGKKMGGKKMMK